MKDVLISSTMSMSDDSFTSESLTIEFVLSNNEINYSLKSLIDIKAADYSFINEVIAQIVYDQLQIKSLTVRIMSRASHRNTDKRRVNQVNENSKLKSEIYLDAKTICCYEACRH